MNCMESIHIMRDYGSIRLMTISIFLMLAFFTLYYVMFQIIHPGFPVSAAHPLLLFGGLVIVYPLHKLLHALPVWLGGYHCHFSVSWRFRGYPLLFCHLNHPVPRNLGICVIVFPGTLLTLLAIISTWLAPQWLLYLAVAATLNIGLSVTDGIYAALLFRAPPYVYIEDSHDSFHLLIPQNVHGKDKT